MSPCFVGGEGRTGGGVMCTFGPKVATEINIKIIIEWGETNYSAYSPDYPGCVATGDTIRETKNNMLSALAMHIKAGS